MDYYTESRSPDLNFRAWWVNAHTTVNDEELAQYDAKAAKVLTADCRAWLERGSAP